MLEEVTGHAGFRHSLLLEQFIFILASLFNTAMVLLIIVQLGQAEQAKAEQLSPNKLKAIKESSGISRKHISLLFIHNQKWNGWLL